MVLVNSTGITLPGAIPEVWLAAVCGCCAADGAAVVGACPMLGPFGDGVVFCAPAVSHPAIPQISAAVAVHVVTERIFLIEFLLHCHALLVHSSVKSRTAFSCRCSFEREAGLCFFKTDANC